MNEKQDLRWKGSPEKARGKLVKGKGGKGRMTIVKGKGWSLVRGGCQLTGSPRQVGEMARYRESDEQPAAMQPNTVQ